MTTTSGNDASGVDAIIPALVSLFQESSVPSEVVIMTLIKRHNADTEGPAVRLEQIKPILRRLEHLYSDNIFPDWIPDRYEYRREIGTGATSRVYLALDREQQTQVAVKIINPGESLPRFERESKLLQQLKSPHIVRQLAFFKGNSELHTKAAIVMEYIDGTYLSDLVHENKGAPHSLDYTVVWMQQVCAAMIAASDQGIVHRDIKPANLIVATEDRSMKLLDFGIATTITGQGVGTNANRLTHSGEVLGTPHYMSPEQSIEPALADIRNDIYSFGATFYHLLTGSTPFTGEDWIDVVYKHRNQVLEAPDATNPQLPKPLAAIIERCMAKRARDRFESFDDIQAKLEPICDRYGAHEDDGHMEPPAERSQISFLSMAPKMSPIMDADDFDSEADKEQVSLDSMRPHLDAPPMSAPPMDSVSPFWGIESERHFDGGRCLQLVTGDILKAAVDCEVLVSSDDSELSMMGGVALRIKQAAGDEYVKQTQHLAPVMPGRVVLSGTGQLPQRFIFHAITIAEPIEPGIRRGSRGVEQRPLITPTPDLIRGILDDCFHHAQSLGLTSMAFPLLGTGNAGMAPDICLRTMVDYICRELNQGLTPLQSIKIVILPS